jgi:hypothetical protein
METFRLDGFRPWLEKATRVQDNDNNELDDVDWSVHTVDYAAFKKRLLEFSKRRAMLRQLLLASDDDAIPATELATILGSQSPLPAHMEASTSMHLQQEHSVKKHEHQHEHQHQRQSWKSTNSTTSATTAQANAEDSSPFLGYVPFVESESNSSKSNMNMNHRVPLNIEIESGDQSSPTTCGDHYHYHSHHVPRLIQLGSDALYSYKTTTTTAPKRLKRRAVMRQVSSAERHDLVVFLSWEIDKSCMFYLAQWQRLSQQLLDFNTTVMDQQSQQLGLHNASVQSPATKDAYRILGQEILELVSFCVINVVTVRQALMRYDAFARQFEGTPMLHYTMKKLLKSPTSFRKLLQHQELKALCDSLVVVVPNDNGNADTTSSYDHDHAHGHEWQESFTRQCQTFATVLESSERAQATATGQPPVNDTVLQTLRYYFMLGTMEDRLGYEPSYLTSRGKSLTNEMQTLAEWRLHNSNRSGNGNGNAGPDPYPYPKAAAPPEPPMDSKQLFNLIMTLLAAFLYCMNYYIVEPSSTMYVNALGAHDAMSGTLIGMMPIASFISATLFSIWTNHSFRQPFLVSCLLLVSGNIIYSAAFNFKSIEMALIGRFLTGLGGPKCIVRRYMADTTSLTMRTSVNAGFGMVVAAGSALGPGCAILLNKLNFAIQIPNGEIWFNGMTGPGYFMALMWGLFAVALFLNFEEPDRSGLEEQKRLEALEKIGTATNALVSPKSDLSTAASTTPSMDSSSAPTTTRMVDGLNVTEQQQQQRRQQQDNKEDDLMTIFSGATSSYKEDWIRGGDDASLDGWWAKTKAFFKLITFPVRLCLGLLFAKVFVIETLVSATSALSKNRYGWQVREVGTLGCVNGFMVIPFSILIGRLSMRNQDRDLMIWLLGIGLFGLFLLIDISDLIDSNSKHYNDGDWLAVNPYRYVMGYFLAYISIQSFEGVIGSALSKVIPTALASGTFNSGLLATLTDTFGRSCGDLFISLVGFINLRQLMNLLFIPGACILITCLIVVRRYYDLLAV